MKSALRHLLSTALVLGAGAVPRGPAAAAESGPASARPAVRTFAVIVGNKYCLAHLHPVAVDLAVAGSGE